MSNQSSVSVQEMLWYASKGPWVSMPQWLRDLYDAGRVMFLEREMVITVDDCSGFLPKIQYSKFPEDTVSWDDFQGLPSTVTDYTITNQDGTVNKVKKVLDHGLVTLVDHMGSDAAIARAARTSFGMGRKMKTHEDDRRLIRRLVRDRHTSPVEMGEVVFYIRLPIFVMRQLVRHRMASLNEFSARYKEMPDLFHVPDEFRKQSSANKQGSAGAFTAQENADMIGAMQEIQKDSFECYQNYLKKGVARELAREVLPVGIYTELYWKQDIHNFLHLAKLRLDPHAQWEIQVFAQAMYDFVKPLFPETCQAFEDYIRNCRILSALDIKMLQDLVAGREVQGAAHYGMSETEYADFFNWWLKVTAD